MLRKLRGWLARWHYCPPWKLTDWWKPRIMQGGDEWHNTCIDVQLPFLGLFGYYYERNFDRTRWFCLSTNGDLASYTSPNYRWEAKVPLARIEELRCSHCDWPKPLSFVEVISNLTSIEEVKLDDL